MTTNEFLKASDERLKLGRRMTTAECKEYKHYESMLGPVPIELIEQCMDLPPMAFEVKLESLMRDRWHHMNKCENVAVMCLMELGA